MSNFFDDSERDSEWFWSECSRMSIQSSSNQEDSFLERVAIKTASGINEADARQQAFSEIIG